MILIGLGNRARHGKDTSAAAIVAHATRLGLPSLRVSWADALYEEVNTYLANSRFTLTGPDIVHGLIENGVDEITIPSWVQPTPNAEVSSRAPYGKHSKLLQWWGTEFRRAQNPNYWIDKAVAVIRKFEDEIPNGVVVVPDTRFFNEAQAIRALGGYTLNVTRLEENGSPYIDPSRDPSHTSETELESYNWDFRIASKNPKLTEKLAVATFEYIREFRGA